MGHKTIIRINTPLLALLRGAKPGLLILLLVLPAACVKNFSSPAGTESEPAKESSTAGVAKFIEQPDIELDPHLNSPLAGLLRFKTNVPTYFDLVLETRDFTHTITTRKLNTSHSVPVLGLRPNREYKATLAVYTKDSTQSQLNKTLQMTTEPLPEGFPNLKVVKRVEGKMEPGFTLFDIVPEGGNSEFGAVIAIVDTYGELVWYQVGTRYTDVRQLDNGNIIFIEGNKIVEMNLLGERIRELQALFRPSKNRKPGQVNTPIFHHEVYPLKMGNYFSLSVEYRAYENYPTSASDPNAPRKKQFVVGDLAVEIRPDGSIRNKWSLLDLLDPHRVGWDTFGPYWGPFFNKKTLDWSHANSIIYSPNDNAVIVTSRHQDATIKFRRKNGELLWILSPHENWDMEKFGKYLLKPVNNQRYFFPYHAHAPEIMPNGNLLIYDNGNYRSSPPDPSLPPEHNFSRAVEYRIDERRHEIELVWEYGQHIANPVFSGALGDADYLPIKNNVLITHGNVPRKDGKLSASILEVTHTTPAEEVFQLNVFDSTPGVENGWRIYRSARIADIYGPEMDVSISKLQRKPKK